MRGEPCHRAADARMIASQESQLASRKHSSVIETTMMFWSADIHLALNNVPLRRSNPVHVLVAGEPSTSDELLNTLMIYFTATEYWVEMKYR